MTEAEIRAVMIEVGLLQRGGRLGKKYIRDNKNTPLLSVTSEATPQYATRVA
jgi:hypothetical protein